jgi:hypothetical protein
MSVEIDRPEETYSTREALESFKLYLKFTKLLDKDIFNSKNSKLKESRLAQKLCEYLKAVNMGDERNASIDQLHSEILNCLTGATRDKLNSLVYNLVNDKEARGMLEPLFE